MCAKMHCCGWQLRWHLCGRFCEPSAPLHGPQLAAASHALQVRIGAHLAVEVGQQEALQPRSSQAQRIQLYIKMHHVLWGLHRSIQELD